VLQSKVQKYLDQSKEWKRVNDPSEGSPTDTLLRLLLPLNYEIRTGSAEALLTLRPTEIPHIPSPHRAIRSVEATGGVYKGQGRNQGRLMTYPY
jgi:hypothetical protein